MNTADIKIPTIDIPQQPPRPSLNQADIASLKDSIKKLLIEKNGVLVAHYYTDSLLQDLAEETGGCVADSLEMARFGTESSADTLIVAGVRFMGETSKILNIEKRVIMPDLNATCSLDVGCPIDAFSSFCDTFPDHTVVVYANTSAEVKARSDWVVTSGIALDIVRHLAEKGEKIIWAPDKHLGSYIQQETGADMILWPGSCIVHERFKSDALINMRKAHPDAAVLVHPESPQDIIDQADVVGSTTGMINAVVNMPQDTFIVATDIGIFSKMKKLAPHKRLIAAPTAGEGASCESCAQCPWMGMNSLVNLEEVLRTEANEIHVDSALAAKAKIPIQRMLDFAKSRL